MSKQINALSFSSSDGSNFGYSCALSADGQTIVVGEPHRPNSGTPTQNGFVYTYKWSTTTNTWVSKGSNLTRPAVNGIYRDEAFGQVLDINDDGTYMVVGSPDSNQGGSRDTGNVIVFQWNSSTTSWDQVGDVITNPDTYGITKDDHFGYVVGISNDGQRVCASALRGDETVNDRGNVSVFEYNSTSQTWGIMGSQFTNTATRTNLESIRISKDGTTVAIGAHGSDTNSLSNNGLIEVYTWNSSTTSWDQKGSTFEGIVSNARIGRATSFNLSSDGSKLIYGDKNSSNHAVFKVYSWNGSSWSLDDTTTVSTDTNANIRSVALNRNGTKMALGVNAYYNAAIKVYEYENSSWTSYGSSNFVNNNSVLTSPVLNTTGSINPFGDFVSITDDGTMISFSNPDWDASWVLGYDGTNWVESTSDAADMGTIVGAVTYSSSSGGSSSSSSSTPICFLRGSKVVMGDGSERDVCDVREGDVLRTQRGIARVQKVLSMVCERSEKAQPYRVGGALLSGNHLVMRGGKMYKASDVGELVEQDELQYYHFKTDGGVGDLLSVGGVWCESWDGHVYGENLLERQSFVLGGARGDMHRMVVRGVRE